VSVSNGMLSHKSGRKASFGELAGKAATMPVPADVKLKDPKDFRLIGKRVPRKDSTAKVNGSAQFTIDMKLPGMLTAVVAHPPLFGAIVKSFDAGKAKSIRGVVNVVQIPSGDQPSVAPPGEVNACDLVTALGGDGTVLKALHVTARTRTPVMGVAYGSLGALTTVPANDLRSALDRFATGEWTARSLPALDVVVAQSHLASAINDVVLARRGGTQLIVEVRVEGELYVRLAGDGIVVATPLGSSAYSMATGGSLLAAGTNGFVCTPLAMHGGCAPPLVVPDDRKVTLEIDPGHGGNEPGAVGPGGLIEKNVNLAVAQETVAPVVNRQQALRIKWHANVRVRVPVRKVPPETSAVKQSLA